jgi:hypothetical protein
MPPRDLVDLNLTYQTSFYFAYREFVIHNSDRLGFEEEDMPDVESAVESDVESDDDSWDEYEHEDLPDSDSSVASEEIIVVGSGTEEDPWDLTYDEEDGVPIGHLRATPPSSNWGDDLDELPGLEVWY